MVSIKWQARLGGTESHHEFSIRSKRWSTNHYWCIMSESQ